jgi:hypothetical protein
MNLQGMTPEKLSALRENAQRIQRKSPADAAAAQMLKDVDQELQSQFPGPDHGWSPGRQGEPRFYREEGQVVATVIRLETHGVNSGGYLIEVRGQPLPEHPRLIDEARRLAEEALGLRAAPG